MAGDPWVVQPHEHAKFAEHFRNLGPAAGHLSGEQAKRFMLQSQLPPPVLGQIWSLADTNADGKLDLKEFSIACKIINLKLHGIEVPKVLPPSLLASLSPAGGQKPQFPPAKPPIPPLPSMPPQPAPSMPAQSMSSNSLLGDFNNSPLINTTPAQNMMPNQPVMNATQTVMANTQPIMGSTQPIMGTTQPIMGSQPLIPPMKPPMPAVPDLISGVKPSLIDTQPIPSQIMNQNFSQPLIGGSTMSMSSVMSTSTSISQSMQPVMGATPLVMPTTQSIMSSQPIMGSTQPIMGSSQPIMGTTQPIMGSTQPIMGSTQPIMGTNQPLIPQSPPHAATAAPSLMSSPPKPMPVTSTPITALKDPASKPGSAVGSVVTSPSEPPLGVLSPPPMEWGIPQPQKLKYTQLFAATDRAQAGAVGGAAARAVMLQSRLPQPTLAQIWALADIDCDGKLGCEEFVLAMYLCERATQGEAPPAKLPADLVPPTFRRDSAASGSSARSYEERRRENLARGQAELERRRDQLLDMQLKEKAERERKEREEAEKKERLRLEAQKREQEELQRKQKEEQEKREAARKEMERQCQLEWEKKRSRELELVRAEAQAAVLALRARALAAAGRAPPAARARALAADIRDTRTAVAAAKCAIDNMRSERDASMSELQQLKARVKELNARQIALNKEKADLDAKAKVSEGGEDGQLNMMEVTLKQLKDKVEAAKAIVEHKQTDLTAGDCQLAELHEQIDRLKDKCSSVWEIYQQRRSEYMQRSTAAAESSQPAEPDWGNSESAWGPDSPAGDAGDAWGDSGDAVVPPAVEPAASQPPSSGPAGRGTWRCLYPFSARAPDELGLQPGDLVLAEPPPREPEPGWRWGSARGQSGWFPESYVEDVHAAAAYADVVEPLETKTQLEGIAEVPEAEIATDLGGAMPVVEGGDFYIAAYPYQSAEPGDLVFEGGERIEVTRRDGDWWTGRIGARTGIFPSNYVTKDPTTAPGTCDIPEAPEPPETLPDQPETLSPAPDRSPPETHAPRDAEEKSSTPTTSEVASITSAAAAVTGGGRRPSESGSGRDSAAGRRKPDVAQVLAPFTATSAEQLSLGKGQLVVVRRRADSGWWEGELQAKGRGKLRGWFPASYVKVLSRLTSAG